MDRTIKVRVFLPNKLTTPWDCKRKYNEVGETLKIRWLREELRLLKKHGRIKISCKNEGGNPYKRAVYRRAQYCQRNIVKGGGVWKIYIKLGMVI